METLLPGLAFAVFLLAQTVAVVAVHATRGDRQWPTSTAIGPAFSPRFACW